MNTIIDRCSGEGMLNQRVLITEVLLLLYGIFLLIFPAKALNLSVGFIGVVMILAGIFCGVWFFLHRQDGNYPLVAVAAIGIIVGRLVLFFRSAIALVLFPVLLGLWTLCTTVFAAFAALGSYRRGNGLWWIPLLATIIGAVVTVLIFINLSGTERFMARILGIYFITYNIIRLGEFGAMKMAPAAPAERRRTQRRKPSSSSRRRVYEEDVDDPTQEYDVYDYEEDDDYAEYRRERNTHSRYDFDDDADLRSYRSYDDDELRSRY